MAHHDGQPHTYRQGLMGQHVTVRRICLGNMGLISRKQGFPEAKLLALAACDAHAPHEHSTSLLWAP